jgi:hypothetical protein
MDQYDSNLQSTSQVDLGPRLYIVGDLKENPRALIKLAEFPYTTNDPFIGFDTFFKLHLSMNLQFPRPAISVLMSTTLIFQRSST